MTRIRTCLLALCLPTFASAQISPDSPFVQSLHDGRASALLPRAQDARMVARKIQEQTGSPGEVTVEFIRISRFESQPQCGRVAYGLYQKSSNTFWGQFGGQINICADGTAPLRQCAGQPGLVAHNAKCKDGTNPTDTDEIKAAVARAVAGGSMTLEQFKEVSDAQAKRTEGKK